MKRPQLDAWHSSRAVSAVLVLLLALALTAVALVVQRAAASQVAPDGELASSAVRAGIMAQAATMAQTAGSYRAAQSQADIAAAERLMTPAMRTKYEADLPPVSQRAEQARMKVTIAAAVASLSGAKGECRGDDCAVSIVSASEDRARLLVFLDQHASAASTTNTVASPIWELLTLVRRDGRWLIDDIATA